MDDQIGQMLGELNLCHLKDVFINESISYSTLLKLNNMELKELIPKMGERKEIILYLERSRGLQNTTLNVYNSCEALLDVSQASTSTMSLNDFSNSTSKDDNFDTEMQELSDFISFDNSTDVMLVGGQKRHCDKDQDDQTSKKIKPPSLIELKDILETSSKGLRIMKYYKENGFLSPALRSDLVGVIVGYFNDSYMVLTAHIAEKLASDIEVIFPTESKGVYFFPANKKNRHNSGGKLMDRYRNEQQKYRMKNKGKIVTNQNKTSEPQLSLTNETLFMIEWLSSNREPWSRVEDYYEKTQLIRLNDKGLDVIQYLEKWPTLKDSRGPSLVSYKLVCLVLKYYIPLNIAILLLNL